MNLKLYYETYGQNPFKTLPVTFLVHGSIDNQSFLDFKDYYDRKGFKDGKSLWIIKPGEDSNCGCGIQVVKTFKEIQTVIKRSN